MKKMIFLMGALLGSASLFGNEAEQRYQEWQNQKNELLPMGTESLIQKTEKEFKINGENGEQKITLHFHPLLELKPLTIQIKDIIKKEKTEDNQSELMVFHSEIQSSPELAEFFKIPPEQLEKILKNLTYQISFPKEKNSYIERLDFKHPEPKSKTSAFYLKQASLMHRHSFFIPDNFDFSVSLEDLFFHRFYLPKLELVGIFLTPKNGLSLKLIQPLMVHLNNQSKITIKNLEINSKDLTFNSKSAWLGTINIQIPEMEWNQNSLKDLNIQIQTEHDLNDNFNRSVRLSAKEPNVLALLPFWTEDLNFQNIEFEMRFNDFSTQSLKYLNPFSEWFMWHKSKYNPYLNYLFDDARQIIGDIILNQSAWSWTGKIQTNKGELKWSAQWSPNNESLNLVEFAEELFHYEWSDPKSLAQMMPYFDFKFKIESNEPIIHGFISQPEKINQQWIWSLEINNGKVLINGK